MIVLGLEEERAALQRANRFFSLPPVYDQGDGVCCCSSCCSINRGVI